MRERLSFFSVVLFSVLASSILYADVDGELDPSFQLVAKGQFGLTGVATNMIQFGNSGTLFDLTKAGGESVTYPFSRFALEMHFLDDHIFELVYQPYYIDTNVVLTANVTFDNKTFLSGENLDTRYNFPFYRLTYFYKIVNNDTWLFAAGGGMQLRNATIWFSSADGSQRFATTSLGPVPLVAMKTNYNFSDRWSMSAEAAGWWSPIPVLNGSGRQVTGWVYDAAIEAGYRVNRYMRWFLEARLVGGGAQGDTGLVAGRTDGYSYNNLNLVNVSTGLAFTLPN